jgi:hypothetical protein
VNKDLIYSNISDHLITLSELGSKTSVSIIYYRHGQTAARQTILAAPVTKFNDGKPPLLKQISKKLELFGLN